MTKVLMTPRSTPVYPKQEVVLEEPIPEWESMIPEELGSRLDSQICCTLDRAYLHIITQLAIFLRILPNDWLHVFEAG